MSGNQPWADQAWADPPSIYRSAPFWAWNAEMKPERLCRQIEQMHTAGMGGFFMHSRYGLKTPYLSEEWFECISACAGKARELDMKAYLYDEDRWPSGAAGGLVTRGRAAMGVHVLVAADRDEFPPELERQGSFAVRSDPAGAIVSYRALDDGGHVEQGEKLVAFAAGVSRPSAWFNDAPYLDTLSAEAVAEFIRLSYQPYADRYAGDFGGVIPAIFTDEPNFSHAGRIDVPGRLAALPWTGELPVQFRSRRGYDIRDHLAELLYPPAGGGFSKVCHDYYRTLTELFVENFSAQIGQWCERHNIALTGHYLAEERFDTQRRCIGAAMPHYEHQQWPGIDMLTDQRRDIAVVKQCSSVADQLARQRVLSELYGCTGWDWPLEGHKFNGGWQYVLGVNFRCPHLSLYSLAGGGKRDYPASIFPHSPWWKYYKTVEDYFARLSLALTQGKAVRDVLVIHTIESGWGLPFEGAAGALQQAFDALLEKLLDEHYDYDLGDESLLARHAKVSKGQLKVGQMSYRLVVVPPAVTLRGSTISLLKRFINSGGPVVFIEPLPDRADGDPSRKLADLTGRAHRCGDVASVVGAIEPLLERRVSVAEAGSQAAAVWTMLRKVSGGQLLFAQSHDRQAGHRVQFSVRGRRPVVLWDAVSGRRERVDASAEGNRVEFELELPPTGSALLSLGLSVRGAERPRRQRRRVSSAEAAGPWAVELLEPNTMPLDRCRYRIGEGEFSEPLPVLLADEKIREHWGLGSRANRGCQPWYLAQTGRFDRTVRGRVEMKFAFHVTDVPRRLEMAIERPEEFEISLNGQAVSSAPTGWWLDEDLQKVDMAAAVAAGGNELLLACDYRSDIELEDLHLLGDFGVRRSGDGWTLTRPPTELSAGSWVGQGLDFYGGAVGYRVKVDPSVREAASAGRRVRLSLPQVKCTCAAVHVGEQTFVLPWAPMAADIAEALAEQKCDEVVVEVIGGRHNILGPLHVPWLPWTGPGEFDPHHEQWTDEYLLNDHGLMSPPVFEVLR